MNSELASALIGGILGGILSPILLERYRKWERERSWAQPRKKLLMQMLTEKGYEARSIAMLCRVTGTTKEDCRSLLIELGARGLTINVDGVETEGWALIKRKPLNDAQ